MVFIGPSNKILVAVRSEDVGIMFDALGFEFDAIICHSLKEAQFRLNENIAVILCGLRFDRGMIFDLLRFAKANPKTRAIPFISIVESNNIFSPAILASIELAAKALGADECINLVALSKTTGDPDAYEALRKIIRQLV